MKKIIIALLFCASSAFAIPEVINYQGYLTDTSGVPLDTTVEISVRLYDGPDAGAFFIFNEIHNNVVVRNGLFDLLIGQYVGLPDLAFQYGLDSMWVGIKVGSDAEMTPRKLMASVGNAYRVGTVDRAAGGEITGNLSVTGKGQFGSVQSSPTGDHTFVAGIENDARGRASVCLGEENTASNSQWVSVTGGFENSAGGNYTHVGGGESNSISSSSYGTIGGGRNNGIEISSSGSTIGGGYDNLISDGLYSAIGGGFSNQITENYSQIGGGYNNTINEINGAIGGGRDNTINGANAVIGGGRNNIANGDYSVIGGGGGLLEGDRNSTSGLNCVVGGGRENSAQQNYSVIGGGSHNITNGERATVSGGIFCRALARGATVAGGDTNLVTTGCTASAIGGGGQNFVNTNATYDYIGGGRNNTIESLSDFSFIGGGQDNIVDCNYGSVVGGLNNQVAPQGHYAAVVGGADNQAGPGDYSFVGGGRFNQALGTYSGVLCGYDNEADGNSSIAGGVNTVVNGEKSFAYGSDITCNSDSAFCFSDGTGPLSVNLDRTFSCLSTGGVRFWTSSDLSTGLQLLAGGGNWISVSDSTKKRNIRDVNTKEILQKVTELPMKQWSYKSQDPSVEHIGPMAQDFWKIFKLGEDSLGIGTIDPAGITLAAIQELAKENKKQDAEIKELRAMIQTLLADKKEAVNRK